MSKHGELRSFFDWFDQTQNPSASWLILGKGPSFALRDQHDLSAYKTISLNHVVREQPVDVAHIIDIDVVVECAESLLANAKMVVLPWYPHVSCTAGQISLEQWCHQIPALAQLATEGRLCWYDLSTSMVREGNKPVVQATYFSAEAALSLLALAGARTIRTLGVDGGNQYAQRFEDLSEITRLSNGHQTFDLQFQGMAKTIHQAKLDFAPLNIPAPVEVFVGSEEPQMLAVKVLEHSIRKNATIPVRVRPLHRCGIEFPLPKDPRNAPRTPFSFQRFAIPGLCAYQGRAIYLDSDMQVFRDIRELWTYPMGQAEIQAVAEPGSSGRRPQFSVMLMDCKKLSDWTADGIVARLDSGELTYERLMFDMAVARNVGSDLPPTWNSLEYYQAGETALLHYTDMDRQPWVTHVNPNAGVWIAGLIDAVQDGFITFDEVKAHVDAGWVRPSLLMHLELGQVDLGWRTSIARWRDRKFIPPYRQKTRRG
jgi:hypothetical protein